MSPNQAVQRVAVVAGLRTPFTQPGGLGELPPESLIGALLSELSERACLAEAELEQLVLCVDREQARALRPAEVLRRSTLGQSASVSVVLAGQQAEYRAVTHLVDAIAAGRCELGAYLGVRLAQRQSLLERFLVALDRSLGSRGWRSVLRFQAQGASAEARAQPDEATRELSARSYALAARAWGEGRFEDLVMPLYLAQGEPRVLAEDQLRGRRQPGATTAPEVVSQADGATALCFASEACVERLGLEPLGWALGSLSAQSAGAAFGDALGAALGGAPVALVELNEGAARLIDTLGKLGVLTGAANSPDAELDRVNVAGGAFAFGDAGAASAGQQVLHLLAELRRRGGGRGVCLAFAEQRVSALALEAS